MTVYIYQTYLFFIPLPSNRQYLSYDNCMEDKKKDYHNCSVLYCVPQLYQIICTLIWAVLTRLGPVGLGLVSLCVCVVFYFSTWASFVCHRVSYVVYYLVIVWRSVRYQQNRLPGKTRLRSDLLCIELKVQLYSLTHCHCSIYDYQWRHQDFGSGGAWLHTVIFVMLYVHNYSRAA